MPVNQEYLYPSHVVHRGSFACGTSLLCYHPAIRLYQHHDPGVREVIWGSDECFRKSRKDAEFAAAEMLKRTRLRQCWPQKWKRPPRNDYSVLYKSAPKIPVIRKVIKREELLAAGILLKDGKTPETRKGNTQLEQERLRDGILGLFKSGEPEPDPEKIFVEPQKPLDKDPSQSYDPAMMFGDEASPDEPQPEQPDGAEPSTTK